MPSIVVVCETIASELLCASTVVASKAINPNAHSAVIVRNLIVFIVSSFENILSGIILTDLCLSPKIIKLKCRYRPSAGVSSLWNRRNLQGRIGEVFGNGNIGEATSRN